MYETRSTDKAGKPARSLWTTPASESSSLTVVARSLVDPTVTAEKIREAVEGIKDRAAVFAGRVSEEVLRASIE